MHTAQRVHAAQSTGMHCAHTVRPCVHYYAVRTQVGDEACTSPEQTSGMLRAAKGTVIVTVSRAAPPVLESLLEARAGPSVPPPGRQVIGRTGLGAELSRKQ